jgi:hypothetical protein
MKKMTCKQMGGMCDEVVMGNTPEEMIAHGMEHLKLAHPEMVASIEAMPKDDPLMVKWQQDFDAAWAATPESE